MLNPKIYKALVANSEGLYSIDVIEFEGGLWLVPEWIDHITEGWTSPARIIRMDTLPYQRDTGLTDTDFVVNVTIPTELLDGKDPQSVKTDFPFEVRDLPEIRVSSVLH